MEDEGKEAVQLGSTFQINLIVLRKLRSLWGYQVQNDFTVRVSLKLMRFLQTLPQRPMIVYLPVDSKNQRRILVRNGLCPRIYVTAWFAEE
jgi:hypothetical protein